MAVVYRRRGKKNQRSIVGIILGKRLETKAVDNR